MVGPNIGLGLKGEENTRMVEAERVMRAANHELQRVGPLYLKRRRVGE